MLPRVILHNAVSLDGRIDWFTPDIGTYYALASRWEVDAILSGSNTALAAAELFADEMRAMEEAEEVEKVPDDPRPLLVVVDSRGRIRNWQVWKKAPYWRDIVVLCSRTTPETYLEYLKKNNLECVIAGEERVDMRAALEELNARYGVRTIRLDSGGTLNGVLLRAGLVDAVSLLIHPALVGGTTPASIYRAPDLTTPEGVIPLRLKQMEMLENDLVWLLYDVARE